MPYVKRELKQSLLPLSIEEESLSSLSMPNTAGIAVLNNLYGAPHSLGSTEPPDPVMINDDLELSLPYHNSSMLASSTIHDGQDYTASKTHVTDDQSSYILSLEISDSE